MILPGFAHTSQNISDNAMMTSFYSFFGDSPYTMNVESYVFLGYSVIFLSVLAIIKYRQNHIWFWLLICGIFIVMSFGPELKIFDQSTGIEMPDKVLYDTIPGWDEIRAPARFVVMANLSLAILASYAVYGLIKNRFSTFKQQLVLTSMIGVVILFEFSMIPYASHELPLMPDIYDEIKNDESKFAVLAAPIGGTGYANLLLHPMALYHQIHHEKPIYGGHESRPSLDEMLSTQTYFLNMFYIFGSKEDVIKQDIATHGLALFDYFDIKYVTLHKKLGTDSEFKKKMVGFIPEARQIMSEILSKDNPDYEDDKTIVYKIPKSNSSEPFLVLGSGWHIFQPDYDARATMKNFEILIINPTDSEIYVTLSLILYSIGNEKIATIYMNDEKRNEITVPTKPTDIQIKNLELEPGTNVIVLDTDEFTLSENNLETSFGVRSILIMN